MAEDQQVSPATQRVELGERSYEIMLGFETLPNFGNALSSLSNIDRIVVVTNNQVGKLYADALIESLTAADFVTETLTISDGEEHKSADTLMSIYNFLIDYHYTRDTMLIALGGGVVGDIAGFAAATYMRGIPYVQTPTSLLAMVDSSVGGKTAINHPHGKNIIGAFYQPQLVYIDCNTLRTLAPEEFRAGFAEVIKYGMIKDEEFFRYCQEQREKIFALDAEAIQYVVSRSIALKADIVAQDETEQGVRAILNFGHTVGHALESITNYKHYKHGEAISIGMIAATRLAARLELCSAELPEELENLCAACELPVRIKLPGTDADEIVERMRKDKKVRRQKLRFVLPRRIGEVEVRDDVPRSLLIEVVESLIESE